MDTQRKEPYMAPAIEIINMDTEATVMVGSAGNLPTVKPGGNNGNAFGTATNRRRSYSGASTSELEDLINDILTIEQ